MTNIDEENNEDENYEVPAGILLPRDNTADYPNWKGGIISGICTGLICGIILGIIPLSKHTSGRIGFAALGFVMGLLLVGAIVAFRPQKN